MVIEQQIDSLLQSIQIEQYCRKLTWVYDEETRDTSGFSALRYL